MPESLLDRRNAVNAGDVCAPIETPIGRLFVAFNGMTISAVGRTAAAVEGSVRTRFARPIQRASALPEPLVGAVAEHLRGDGQTTLRFDLGDLPEFDQAVLRTVQEIPRGEVRSYAWIAQQLGQPRAAKDVGLALAQNPIPLLIPCHRVVYSDGRISGYIFGTRAKRALLRAEGFEAAA